MAEKTGIVWTDSTWNVVTGCTPCAAECAHCWAGDLHDKRHRAYVAGKKMPEQYAAPFSQVQLHPARLEQPLHWKRPRLIFPCSTGDLFHGDVPEAFLVQAYAVMALCSQHRFQVLTKRPWRQALFLQYLAKNIAPLEAAARELGYTFKFGGKNDREYSLLPWPIPNIWAGTTIGTRERLKTLTALRDTPAAVRWLSVEPLLEDLGTLNLDGIHWVVIGCEAGTGRRPMHIDWLRSLVEQCRERGVAVFVKQIEREGKVTGDINDFPLDLRLRQSPEAR